MNLHLRRVTLAAHAKGKKKKSTSILDKSAPPPTLPWPTMPHQLSGGLRRERQTSLRGSSRRHASISRTTSWEAPGLNKSGRPLASKAAWTYAWLRRPHTASPFFCTGWGKNYSTTVHRHAPLNTTTIPPCVHDTTVRIAHT